MRGVSDSRCASQCCFCVYPFCAAGNPHRAWNQGTVFLSWTLCFGDCIGDHMGVHANAKAFVPTGIASIAVEVWGLSTESEAFETTRKGRSAPFSFMLFNGSLSSLWEVHLSAALLLHAPASLIYGFIRGSIRRNHSVP